MRKRWKVAVGRDIEHSAVVEVMHRSGPVVSHQSSPLPPGDLHQDPKRLPVDSNGTRVGGGHGGRAAGGRLDGIREPGGGKRDIRATGGT